MSASGATAPSARRSAISRSMRRVCVAPHSFAVPRLTETGAGIGLRHNLDVTVTAEMSRRLLHIRQERYGEVTVGKDNRTRAAGWCSWWMTTLSLDATPGTRRNCMGWRRSRRRTDCGAGADQRLPQRLRLAPTQPDPPGISGMVLAETLRIPAPIYPPLVLRAGPWQEPWTAVDASASRSRLPISRPPWRMAPHWERWGTDRDFRRPGLRGSSPLTRRWGTRGRPRWSSRARPGSTAKARFCERVRPCWPHGLPARARPPRGARCG